MLNNARKNDYPGVLISLEGCEGGGKTTQVARLKEKMQQKGWEVVTGREPGGTKIGEEIREVVLSKKNMEMFNETEVLLYQASRAQLYGEVIIPALVEGKVVLMDRTGDSSVVYQGMARGFEGKIIKDLNNFSMQGVRPDLTILLDLPVEVGMKRQADLKMNRIELQGLAFHEKVREGYLKLAEENDAGRWRVVDATKKIDEVEEQIWQIVEDYLLEKFEQKE